jgi:signal transduction histidine kinase
MDHPRGTPRLVARFAVGSLVAFVLIGTGVGAVLVRYVRAQAEERGTFHARFIADAVLPLALGGVDLTRPVTGADRARIDAFVRSRILTDGRDVRIKIWRPDATVVYSDEPALIGRRFPDEAGDLAEAMSGGPESGVSNLAAPENLYERHLADKLFFTYVPLRLTADGPVVAIAEVYQDYAILQGDIDGLLRTLGATLGVGLVLLYAALLPIAIRASRDMRRQNVLLNELLEREQASVEELRAANAKKDDFVAAVSHELRTPLTSIIGYLSTLRQPGPGDDAAVREEFLSAADAQTKRLLRLITNVLSVASLDDRERRLVPERIDLALMLREVLDALPRGQSRVRVAIQDEAGTIVADRARLSEVLANLLDNALKYSPEAEAVDVTARRTGDGGVRLEIRDRGIGIPAEERESIFDRFHQRDQSSTRRYGGLGLGLYIVKTRLRDLGATVEVDAAPEGGSVFSVMLPPPDPSLARVATAAASPS